MERDFVAELLAAATPEQIAAAYLRQQLAARPVPEDLIPLPVAEMQSRKPRHAHDGDRDRDASQPREPRRADMEGGVWFTLSVGRKHRADPKWLLPMICKAGGVSKRDVGSIKIDDTETRFEIAADKANGFAARIREPGSVERGVTISPSGHAAEGRGEARERHAAKPRPAQDARRDFKADPSPSRSPSQGSVRPRQAGRSRQEAAPSRLRRRGNRLDPGSPGYAAISCAGRALPVPCARHIRCIRRHRCAGHPASVPARGSRARRGNGGRG